MGTTIEAIRFSWLCKVKTTYESNYGKWVTVDITFQIILPYTILVSIGAFRNAEIDRSSRSSRGDRDIDSLHSEYRYADTRELWYKPDTIFDQINLLENLLIENCYVETTVKSDVQIFIK